MSAQTIFASANGQTFRIRGSVLRRELIINDLVIDSKIRTHAGASPSISSWWSAYLSGARPVPKTAIGRTLRSMDLFSGAGGLALGLRQAADELGFSTHSVVAIDQDQDALAVYRRNHSTDMLLCESVAMLVSYQIIGDVENAEFFAPPRVSSRLEHLRNGIDIILAGPPCQGHSNLNNHSRRDDDRNELYLTVPAMAVALNVPTIIIENVPGVVHDRRSVVSTTVSLLRNSGYQITCGTIAAHHMGWPQTRKRFFLVATKGYSPVDIETVMGALQTEIPLSVSWALDEVQPREADAFMDVLPQLSDENQRRVNFLIDNDLHDLPNEERPDCHKEGTTYKSVYGRMRADQPAPTLTAGFLSPGRGRFTHPTEPRSLTLREAARLQGFPADYDFRANSFEDPARTDVARWIGNAVPMPLGYAACLAALLPRMG
jgi:DNA (cytosine-5)-methyltransferase 1